MTSLLLLNVHSRSPADDVREVPDAALGVGVLEDDAADVPRLEADAVHVHDLDADAEGAGAGGHAADRLGVQLVRQQEPGQGTLELETKVIRRFPMIS